MKIIIDSNILFSAMIKDSTTRSIILEYDGQFLFPEFIFQELKKHKVELLRKSKMKESEFNNLLDIILSKVKIIHNEEISHHKHRAWRLVKDIDPNDAIFIATALTIPQSIIWSNDQKLKAVKRVKVFNTAEIIKIMYGT